MGMDELRYQTLLLLCTMNYEIENHDIFFIDFFAEIEEAEAKIHLNN